MLVKAELRPLHLNSVLGSKTLISVLPTAQTRFRPKSKRPMMLVWIVGCSGMRGINTLKKRFYRSNQCQDVILTNLGSIQPPRVIYFLMVVIHLLAIQKFPNPKYFSPAFQFCNNLAD